MKELRKEIDKARTEISVPIWDKEMSERRLKMAKQEVHLHNDRIQKLEADNLEPSSEFEKTHASMRELVHELR